MSDLSDNDIMAMAEAADRGEALPPPPTAPEAAPQPPAAGTTEGAPEEAQPANPEATDSTPPPEPPNADAATPPEQKAPEAKPESEYVRKKKDAERQAKGWKQLEAEKAAARQQAAENQRIAAELAAQAAALRQMQQERQQPPPPPPAQPEYTPADFEAAAERLEREGKFDLAEFARQQAAQAKRAPAKPAAQPQAQAAPAAPQPMIPGTPQFNAAWQQTTQQIATLDPELTVASSPIRLETAKVLQSTPHLHQRPDGIAYAYHTAIKNLHKAALTENASLKAEIARLNKTNALHGSPPGAIGTTTKSIHDMTQAEADEYVLRAAQEADRGGG